MPQVSISRFRVLRIQAIVTRVRELPCSTYAAILILLLANPAALPAEPGSAQPLFPPVPVGWDAFLQWDHWPQQRVGTRAYMRSTYDRSGSNDDMSNYLFMREETHNVTLDVAGTGALVFFRANFWHGSPWHFVVDGTDNLVKETATDDPVDARKRLTHTEFIPGVPFPEPLAWTWSTTKGADLIGVPIPFSKSLQIANSRTAFGTGYYIYKLYAGNEGLTQPITTWDASQPPDPRVIALLNRSGTDIAPKDLPQISGTFRTGSDRTLLASLQGGPQVIRAIKFSLPLDDAIDLERLRLRITWDDRDAPSIDAPLCLFFGAGTLYNRDEREYLVKGFPINVRFDYEARRVQLGCYFPMPFFKSARIELAGDGTADSEIEYEIRTESFAGRAAFSGYFHATYRNFPTLPFGEDLTLLDTRRAEGGGAWSGNFVGTSLIFSHGGDHYTLEGDPRFYFDDSETPQVQGTGTEEWCGGGFYWGGENMTLPFYGHPCGAPSREKARNERDLIQSCYRFLLADLMPFGRRALIRLEHGPENMSEEHYESVAYWYGLPAAALVKTDELNVGNVLSEQGHDYTATDVSDVQTVVSRYETGIDTIPETPWSVPGDTNVYKPPGYERWAGRELHPAKALDGRVVRGSSEFTLTIDPRNLGVLLRRTLDYRFPNQRAKVYLADAGSDSQSAPAETTWKFVGIWYLAGSNTWIHSFPRGELDTRVYDVRTSERRFRDDEFLIPASMTRGKSRVRLRIEHVPDSQALYPEHPFPEASAWSELGYSAYSYVAPDFDID